MQARLKTDGWDYGRRSIHYEAALQDAFPGGRIPSVATIPRLVVSSVGQVDPAPRGSARSPLGS